ncbi:MAG: phage holin family protein [Candidatus Symbiothrix sp.]|jgi:small-conductance mechanosensitive channel|nr:phage holin family protein [Candidatus Symbiothrix sp.]
MENQHLGTLLSALKTDAKELLATKFEWLRLDMLEKTSATGSVLIYSLIILNIVFFALLFAFLAFGLWIGDLVHNLAGGFAIVTLFYILLLFVLVICRKSVFRTFQNWFLKALYSDLKDSDESPLNQKI